MMDTSELLGVAQYGSNGTPPDSGSEGVVNTLLDAAESAFPQLKLARQVLKTKFGYDVTFYFIGLYVLYGLSFPLSWLLATIRPSVVWLFTSSIVIPRGSQAFESCIDWVTANVVNERSRLSGGAQTLTAFSGNKNRNRRGPHMPMDYNDGFINPYTGHPDGSLNDDTFRKCPSLSLSSHRTRGQSTAALHPPEMYPEHPPTYLSPLLNSVS